MFQGWVAAIFKISQNFPRVYGENIIFQVFFPKSLSNIFNYFAELNKNISDDVVQYVVTCRLRRERGRRVEKARSSRLPLSRPPKKEEATG